jgi:hypothetical protein
LQMISGGIVKKKDNKFSCINCRHAGPFRLRLFSRGLLVTKLRPKREWALMRTMQAFDSISAGYSAPAIRGYNFHVFEHGACEKAIRVHLSIRSPAYLSRQGRRKSNWY